MCDYSLMSVPNRLAKEGEELVVHRFQTGALGLAAPCPSASRWWSAKQIPAVCVPPGARLRLRDIPKRLQRKMGVGPAEEVIFVQLSAMAFQFRDAVRFRNGQEILLQKLTEGIRVDVLALSSGEREHEEHRQLEEEYQRVFL